VGAEVVLHEHTLHSLFKANAVRLQLHALAYSLANFLRTLALPAEIAQWSMTTLRERLAKIGAKIVRHGRSITFQMAEVVVPRQLFEKILTAIAALRRRPPDAEDRPRLRLSGYQQERRAPMQARGLRFSLSQRSSVSRQGVSRLPSGITVAGRPDRWLSCLRGAELAVHRGNTGLIG
jgi:hypothetical protein